MPMLNRRELLKLTGSAALLSGCGNALVEIVAGEDRSGTRPLFQQNPALLPTDAAFPIGVMAGDAMADRCVVWTRFDGGSDVRLRVWEDVGRDMVNVAYDAPVTFKNGFALVDVEGLLPDRSYRYAFVAGESSRSPVGNFRTAFAPDSYSPLTFGGTCCTKVDSAPFPTLAQAALWDLRFFVHNGDHVYCDGQRTVDEYRGAYQASYQTAGMQAVHQQFGWYGTWDDHEVSDNWDPETIDPDHFAAAQQAYFEHTPMRVAAPGRIWRSFRWGLTAEIFMLDCRSERLPSTRKSDFAQYISRDQLHWLKQSLLTSPCQFKFIINSVPIASFGGLWDFKIADRWAGYKAQREDLLDFMVGERIRGAYFCSGDFHCGFTGRIETDGPYSGLREIAWGPGGQRINPLYRTLNQPQWDFASDACNFVVLTADPAADALQVDFINENGSSLGSVQYPNG